jgi:hypothetical protein
VNGEKIMEKQTDKIIKEIRQELENGINRNKVLPLDWAMDRITPIIQQAQKGMIKIEDVKILKESGNSKLGLQLINQSRELTLKDIENEFIKKFYFKNHIIVNTDLIKEFRKYLKELGVKQ